MITRTLALDLLVLAPLFGAAVAWLMASRSPHSARWVAVGALVVQLGLLVALAPLGAFSGAYLRGGQPGAGSVWSLATDGVSTPLVVLTVVVGFGAVAAAWRTAERPASFMALLLLLQGAVTAVFLADNVILFYVAWEAVLIPMFFLIGGWGHEGRRHAAMKFFIFTMAGSALMLVGLLLAVVQTQSFELPVMVTRSGAIAQPELVFWLLMLGFLVKIPVVPLHTWLPDAHVEAPTAGSIVLAGVLLKMGGYGIFRLALPLAPRAFDSARPVLLALGLVGIVWGALMALAQTDLKRLVAYSSVAHMGFMVLAIAACTADSFGAAMVIMISHGLVAPLQFYLVGAMYDRTHTRELSRLGGLGRLAPMWGVAFVFGAMASLGLPGLSGFPGEFVSILEGYRVFGWWSAVAALGVVLAAAYGLRAVARSVQGPTGEFESLRDLDVVERSTTTLFVVAIVALGVAPWLVLDVSGRALAVLAALGGGR